MATDATFLAGAVPSRQGEVAQGFDVNDPMTNWFIGDYILVGGDLTILKNMSSPMGRMTSHILSKIKFMFQTTNQYWIVIPYIYPNICNR